MKNSFAAALVILLDQAGKYLVLANTIPYLRPTRNPGLPFIGDLSGIFNAGLVSAALIIFVWLYFRYLSHASRFGFALIVGGALSNIIDRIPDGAVTDFIYLGVATVNLADIAIWTGIVLLILKNKRTKERKNGS